MMRQYLKVLLAVCLLLSFTLLVTPTWAQETSPQPDTYTVQAGDTLFRIAVRFGTTVDALAAANGITNPQQIYVGQVLQLPGTGTSDETTPDESSDQSDTGATAGGETQPETPPAQAGTYVVQPGDTLFSIATRNNVTVPELVAANNLSNQNVIFVGQELIIPGIEASAPEETAPGTDTTGSETTTDTETNAAISFDAGFDYGIEVFFQNQDINPLVQQVNELGMHWVKVRVDWRAVEPNQGEFNFGELDSVVNALDARGTNILFTVVNAPAWARTSPDENGPPDDLANFLTFMNTLVVQYTGVVDAYEIWDEPNLRRNWNCERRMCDTDYLEMLRLAFTTVKAIDPNAQVITAGLAPTRFNDRINAIDDRLYLETLYANGVADISDGIGAHPGGWANPPDAECCTQPVGVETHFENDVFYFKDNLEAYHDIMTRYGDTDTPIWVTRFGWGTSEDTEPPADINVYVTYTSLSEQAIYVPRAFELGQELGYIGPMFVDNLNGCQGMPNRPEVCYYSLISPTGAPRLVYSSVQQIDKSMSQQEVVPGVPIENVPLEPAVVEPTAVPEQAAPPVETTEEAP